MREVEEEEGWGVGGSRSDFMVDLSLSQPLEIAKQFTIIQSINLSRAGGTRCPRCRDETLCMPDESTRGNNSFSGPNKETERQRRKGRQKKGGEGAKGTHGGGQGVMCWRTFC